MPPRCHPRWCALGIVTLVACADGGDAARDAALDVRPAEQLPIAPAFYAAYGVSPADELVDQRDLHGYTFGRADGKRVSVIGVAPLNHRGRDGRFRPIDTAIVATADGGWANADNVLRTTWSADVREGVVIAADGVTLRWTPGTVAGRAPEHGIARVAGSTLVAAGMYSGADEEWTVGRGQLKHDVVLVAPPEADDADGWFVVDGTLDGDAVELETGGVRRTGPFETRGAIDLVARASGARLRLDVPFAHERDRREQQVAAVYRVEPLAGGGVRVAVAVPLAWLRDPARRYPVVIDPTVSIGSVTGTLPVYLNNETVEDCAGGQLVRGGATSFFRIGLVDNNGPPVQGFWCYRGAFKFSTAAIPDNATVSRVDLNAFVLGNGAVGDVDFVRLGGDPAVMSTAALFAAMDASAVHYVTDYVPPASGWFVPLPTTVGINLGPTAAADLQARLASDAFALGSHRGNHADEWTVGPNVHHFLELTRVNLANEPVLYVTYTAPPAVTAVSPLAGRNDQTTAVTITGANFEGVTGVTINGTPLTSVTGVNGTTITATVPAGIAPGSYPVIVTTPIGTSAGNTVTFTSYVVGPPRVLSISPSSGRNTGTTAVTIQGTSFGGASGVTINGRALTGVTVVNDTRITATVPFDIAPGVYPVIVTTPLGTSAGNTVDFTVIAGVSSVPWSTGFESGDPLGVLSGLPEPGGWHVESSNACYAFTPHGGARWLHEGADVAGGTYSASVQYHSYTFGPFDLSGSYSALTFSLWKWLRVEGKVNGRWWDGVNVKLSTDGGATWSLITPAGGYPETAIEYMDELSDNEPGWAVDGTGWTQESFDLLPYVGQTDVRVRLVFASDASGEDCGPAIDDVALTGTALGPPAPAIGVLSDGDTTGYAVDGRDVTVTFTEPANTTQVSFYRVYLLRAAVPLSLGAHVAFATVAKTAPSMARSFTGTAALTTDSAGQPLVAGSYHAYVVSVDLASRTGASASTANANLVADCTDVDGDGLCVGGGDCNDAIATCGADCTTDVDTDGTVDCADGCIDRDGDAYGSAGGAVNTCSGPDCNDTAAAIHPGAPETCNTIDDDCSAATADGSGDPGYGAACDGGDGDLCAEGTNVCAGGVASCSDTSGTSIDVCNFADDDCNPATANGSAEAWYAAPCDGSDGDQCIEGTYGCVGGAQACSDATGTTVETCNGADDDCNAATADGSADPGYGQPCDGADGDLCTEGTNVCQGGVASCTDASGTTVDVCNGADDDCNAATVDGSAGPGFGQPCDGGDGDLCIEGTNVCQGGVASCSDVTGTTVDVCNFADDDCNPATVNGSAEAWFGQACDGADGDLCAEGTSACTGGAQACSDATGTTVDTCNALDDDCNAATVDGSADPGFGQPCDGGDGDLCIEGTNVCQGGVASCSDVTGTTVDVCNGANDDCNAATADGSVEAWYGAPCDGADGDLCIEGAYGCVAGAQACGDATATTTDLCNGADDDCDAATADGSAEAWLAMPCDGADTDVCQEGTYSCASGAQSCSDATGSTVETCNAVDDDCDVSIDEGACVDECAQGLDDCDANATCTDLPAGFTCACNSGFAGNGQICTDIDECTAATDDCSDFATCTNTPGSFTCACIQGYAGDGRTCTLEPGWECTGAPPNTVCVPRCGDGLVVGDEECDDNNLVGGDGCTDCTWDPGWGCDGGLCDRDMDGIGDDDDNCPDDANPAQEDLDGDTLGDACDPDRDGDGFLDGGVAGGGGCGCRSAGGAGERAGGVLVLLAALVGLRGRRRRRWLGAAAALALVVVAPRGARAQADHDGFAVERFRLAGDGDGLLAIDWADVPHHGSWEMSLWASASHDPLVVYATPEDGGEEVAELVARRVTSGLGGTYALWQRLQLSAGLTAVAFQDDRNAGNAFAMMPAPLPSGGLSDARLAAKVLIVGGRGARLHVAFHPAVVVPLGDARGYLREAGPTFEPELVTGIELGAVRLAVELGYRMRKNVSALSLDVGDELHAGVGAGISVGERADLMLTAAANTAAASPLAGADHDAVELLGGATYQIGNLQLFAAGGGGLGTGYGTPDWRVVAGTRYRLIERDRDGDRLVDRRDRCPLSGEDADGFEDDDGCPELDDDGDGIADTADRCRVEGEDQDGFEDGDGCPDRDDDADGMVDGADKCPRAAEVVNGLDDADGCPDRLPVVLRGTVSGKGAPLAGADVTVTTREGPRTLRTDGAGTFTVELADPESVTIEARARKFTPVTVTAEVPAQLEPTQVAITLEPQPPMGEIRGLIRDFGGKALTASATLEPGNHTARTDADGMFRLQVPPGTYTVSIEAAGHKSQKRKVTVQEDGVTVLNADLKRGR